jgi:cell division protein FtsB
MLEFRIKCLEEENSKLKEKNAQFPQNIAELESGVLMFIIFKKIFY